MRQLFVSIGCFTVLFIGALSSSAIAQGPGAAAPAAPPAAWMDATLSVDARAGLVLKQMTLEEKINLLHGTSGAPLGALGAGMAAAQSNGGAGMFGGVPRLNIPAIQMHGGHRRRTSPPRQARRRPAYESAARPLYRPIPR